MIISTRGIVLRVQPYSDTYDIASFYSSERGLIALRVPRSKSARSSAASWRKLLQPLRVVDVVLQGKNNHTTIFSLSEVRLSAPIPISEQGAVRMGLTFFMTEFLERVLRNEPPEDELLYRFTEEAVVYMANCTQGLPNFHIAFLMRMLAIKGYLPSIDDLKKESASGKAYDLSVGAFVMPTSSSLQITPQEVRFLPSICRINFYNMHCYRFSREQRHRIIYLLLRFYKLHHPGVGEIKSLEVLTELFD